MMKRIISGLLLVAVGVVVFPAAEGATELLGQAKGQLCLLDKAGAVTEWKESVMIRSIDPMGYRLSFKVADPSAFLSLTLEQPANVAEITLNGKPVPYPVAEMEYMTVPGIPAEMLNAGENVIEAKTFVSKKQKRRWKRKGGRAEPRSVKPGEFSLKGLVADDLTLRTGPVLGSASHEHITVACRVSMPAAVRLVIDGRTMESPVGLFHQFKAEGLNAGTDYTYQLQGRAPGSSKWKTLGDSFAVRTYPAKGDFQFVALGDSRSNPDVWNAVSKAAAAHQPIFCVSTGDLVDRGLQDYLWDEELFEPGKEFLATVPYYAIMGNHEDSSPLFNKIFPTPNGTPTWEQRVGSVHLIAIDGEEDWSAGSEKAQWLENVLAASKAKFIFLFTHFPAWSSGMHGRINDKGEPREQPVRDSQKVILPLLAKYNACALLAGHDHCYERSETPDGVPVIITGGAGAGLRDKVENSEVQNPYSTVFAAKHHYCHFSVQEDVCTMKVLTAQGELLDTREWKARKINP